MAASADRSRQLGASSEGSTEPEGFAIRLPSAQLADLIQLNCINRIRGAFRVSSGPRIGHLFFEHGQLVHAEFDDTIGLDAVVQMLGWRSGSIEPCNEPWPPVSSIDMGADALLLHAAQRIDEAAARTLPGSDEITTKVVRRVDWTPELLADAETRGDALGPDPSGIMPTPERSSWAPSGQQLAELEIVQVTAEGKIKKLKTGASTELADTSYFCQHMGTMIGIALNLGECQAVSLESPSEGIVVFKGRSIVGTRGKLEALEFILQKVGLK